MKVRMKLGLRTQACLQVTLESNVCNEALHVIGLYGPSEQGLSLPGGLGACEGGIKLSQCPRYVVPGNA